MAAKLCLFVTLSFLIAVAVQGCAPHCSEPAYPTPPVMPTYSTPRHCPADALKLQVCASVLGGLVDISLPGYQEACCLLVYGLVDIDAAACLCTVLNVNVLKVPIDISVLLNRCNKKCPSGFTCPPRY